MSAEEISYSKGLPLIDKCDILVIGGSQSGVAAAVCAKRSNPDADVLLIEQFGYLGGQSVGTMVVHYEFREYVNNAGQRIVKGFGHEIIKRVVEKGHTDPLFKEYLEGTAPPFTDLPDNRAFGDIPLDLEDLKLVLQELCEEAGVRIRYFTKLADIIAVKGASGLEKPEYAVIDYQKGLAMVKPKVVIDCTANNDVAWFMGGEKYVNIPDHQVMPMQTYAWFGGVDLLRFINSVFEHPEYWPMKNPDDHKQMLSYMRQGKTIQMRGGSHYIDIADEKYPGLIMKYLDTGANPPIYYWLKTIKIHEIECDGEKKYIGDFAMEGPVYIKDQTDPEIVNRCMISQLHAVHIMCKMHSVMPGWESCYVKRTSQRMGFRQTRILDGEYQLKREDVYDHKRFDDVIGRNPGHDVGRGKPEEEYGYDVPYRILVPKKIDGLLVGARSVSCDPNGESLKALNAHRGICATIVCSQASGVAAGLCLEKKIEPREIDIKELQDKLKDQDVILDPPPEGPQGFYQPPA